MNSTQARSQHDGLEPSGIRTYFAFSGYYLCTYYALGAFYPLLTQYYKAIQLSGVQIGLISAITPIVSMLAQPMWGMLCDRYQIRKRALIIALLVAAMLSLIFTQVSTFAWVLFLFVIFSLFQCAVNPISDSLALTYAQKRNIQFGNLRLWGAVGYAIAAYLTGLAVEAWGPHVIFYFFFAAFLCSIPFLRGIPEEAEGARFSAGIFSGLKDLMRLPRFVLFLLACFFVFGSVNANNIWFSLYYQHIGGSIAGIGLAFFLFAGSEAPFMRVAAAFIRRWGLEMTILIASSVSMLRWLWYGTTPSTTLVIVFFFLQGISVGFYLASAAQFVRENTPAALQVTALAIFSSIGQGLGSMTCNLLAGVIADYFGIVSVYWFFGTATLIGLIPLLLICFGPYKKQKMLATR